MKSLESKVDKDDSVHTYIDKMNPELQSLAKRLMSIIRKAIPKAQGRIWMNVPNYTMDGVGIVSIADYSHHINLYFFSGAKLQSNLLQGTGKELRHIKITSQEDINEKEITRLLKLSATLVTKSRSERSRSQ